MKERHITHTFEKFMREKRKFDKYRGKSKNDNNRILEEKNKQPTTNGKANNSVNE